MRKRFCFFSFLTILFVSFVGLNSVDAMIGGSVASGKSGDCNWILYEDGNLRIGTHLSDLDDPNEPNSCTLGEPIKTEGLNIGEFILVSPWYDYSNDVKKIYFSGTVYANSNSSHLFSDLYYLNFIDFSNFVTKDAIDMSYMFSNDVALKSVDLSNFDTSNVTNMMSMFSESGFTSLDLSSFDTSKVTDMSAMFSYDNNLKNVNLSSFDTSKVTDMSVMFLLTGLESLDLSSFNTSNVTSMMSMFAGSSYLEKIIVGDGFDTSNVLIDSASNDGLFDECTSLIGGNGTKYDSSKTDVRHAVVDRIDNPGYFTSVLGDINIEHANVTGIKTQTYNGKAQRQNIIVTLNGKTLVKDVDYQVLYDKLINAGTVKMTIKGINNYDGKLVKTFTRKKAKNPFSLKYYNKTVYYSKVKSSAQVVKPIYLSNTKNAGKITYEKQSGSSSKLLLNKVTGKVTVKKGTAKGKYKIRVKVRAAGTSNYNPNYKIITIYVTVK